MKYLFIILLISLVALSGGQAQAQTLSKKKHKVVMQVTSADTAVHRVVIGHIENIRRVAPNAQFAVVCHSGGIFMLAKDNIYKEQIDALAQNGVTWSACENTMRMRKVGRERLTETCKTVPSGVFEIISKQESGWIYLKE